MGENFSAYDFVNNFIPGAIFGVLVSEFSKFNFLYADSIVSGAVFFSIGIVLSRIGSLVVGPFLDIFNSETQNSYEEYVDAASKDAKIDKLSETRNMYRCIVTALIASSIFIVLYFEKSEVVTPTQLTLAFLFCIILFSYAYLKQGKYIEKRINMQKTRINK
jgi:hypothetical protein